MNGKSLGRKNFPAHEHLEWNVPYTPGSLVAKGFIKGKLIVSDKVETTGAPAAIVLKTDRTNLIGDAEDLSPVEVAIVDAKGRVVPYASNKVRFTVTGNGVLAGVGNGDPSSHEPDQAPTRSAFHGLCMALVRAKLSNGQIKLTATAPGLKSASITLTSNPSSEN